MTTHSDHDNKAHHHHDHDHTETPHEHTAIDVSKQSACSCSKDVSHTKNIEAVKATADDYTLIPPHWDSLLIEQMDCPTEERLIREAFKDIEDIKQLEFNLIKRVLRVQHCYRTIKPLQQKIAELGMQAVVYEPNKPVEQTQLLSKHNITLLIAGIFALLSELFELAELSAWLIAPLSLIAIVMVGIPTYTKGIIAIKNKTLNINSLMSIAVTGAILIGSWPEAAMVIVLFTLAEQIEALSLQRARNAIGKLLQLAPSVALVSVGEDSWQEQPVEDVALDSIIWVKPGQKIPLDGEILTGQTTVDQSAITGESIPVEKTVGDLVFAGTLNGNQTITFKVTRLASDSTLAKIIQQVEEAQSKRAETQRFVDQFAQYYTPIVVGIAAVIALITFPEWIMTGQFTVSWIYRALIMLVIACPCALVISTPVTIVSGLTRAARLGILIKGGTYLEQGAQLQWLAVDKTGTLTKGEPEQTDVTLLSGATDNTQQIAASLANQSNHPVSLAIAKATQAPRLSVENFEALLGLGVNGVINGTRYYLGNYRLIKNLGLDGDTVEKAMQSLEQQGKTVTLLANDQAVLAVFAVADTLKQSSLQAISELHQLGIKVLMLTGDNPYTANAIGKQVGIDEVMANLLPEDKLAVIDAKINQGIHIGMVGDGINDTPALARAEIGFAMGAAGTDSAIETADIALMDDDLRKLPLFIRLAKATKRVLTQNISFAIGIKVLFLIMTLFNCTSLWLAVFADIGVSLMVVFNGLRLLRFK